MCAIELEPAITTRRLRLRKPRKADAARLADYANDFDVARMTTGMPYPYGVEHAEGFLEKAGERFNAADKASEHLAAKLRFAASRIATADDFIRDLASRSSVSGEAYRVKCGNVDTPAGFWLTDELQRYRKSRVRAAR